MLKAEQIQENWDIFLNNIEMYITGDRKRKLLEFYKKGEEIIILYPASTSNKYHSSFPGGYIYHVNKVVQNSIYLYKLWKSQGANVDNYTLEELVFSAINHDLGKIGSIEKALYIPQKDEWRKKNLEENYTFNTSFEFMSVPDRSLFLLQQAGITMSENEFISIKIHDGLYDSANDVYLKSYSPETKPRINLPYILHQADLMAARIEFEQQYLIPKKL